MMNTIRTKVQGIVVRESMRLLFKKNILKALTLTTHRTVANTGDRFDRIYNLDNAIVLRGPC